MDNFVLHGDTGFRMHTADDFFRELFYLLRRCARHSSEHDGLAFKERNSALFETFELADVVQNPS